MKKIGVLIVIWVAISLAYVIIAFMMPVLQDFTDDTATELQATSNMSDYPGTLEAVNSFPLFAWFIPGGVGIGATVWMLKKDSD